LLMSEGILPKHDSTTMALELWTAAHGVAAMLISRPYLPWGEAEEFADRVLRTVVVGQIVSGAIGLTTDPQDVLAQLKGLLNAQDSR
jgi:hypothetical protein